MGLDGGVQMTDDKDATWDRFMKYSDEVHEANRLTRRWTMTISGCLILLAGSLILFIAPILSITVLALVGLVVLLDYAYRHRDTDDL